MLHGPVRLKSRPSSFTRLSKKSGRIIHKRLALIVLTGLSEGKLTCLTAKPQNMLAAQRYRPGRLTSAGQSSNLLKPALKNTQTKQRVLKEKN